MPTARASWWDKSAEPSAWCCLLALTTPACLPEAAPRVTCRAGRPAGGARLLVKNQYMSASIAFRGLAIPSIFGSPQHTARPRGGHLKSPTDSCEEALLVACRFSPCRPRPNKKACTQPSTTTGMRPQPLPSLNSGWNRGCQTEAGPSPSGRNTDGCHFTPPGRRRHGAPSAEPAFTRSPIRPRPEDRLPATEPRAGFRTAAGQAVAAVAGRGL